MKITLRLTEEKDHFLTKYLRREAFDQQFPYKKKHAREELFRSED